ncbi:flagellar basal body rod protein FlgC [Metallumcola ferriviriculae]|uniref:Flagellar basal-body rod protein FlgC n=1 Tax=Metallumcola ferriviriculae TaxID=3039180 RepID=A0AAU0URK8_9FIRM|nr:flagellar basal body rod protein FlgC [Desulfitibacteraceae bacterium MK1]
MKLFQSMATSVSALTAERLRMDLISSNIANINTTRTAEGGPYRRKVPIFAEVLQQNMEGETVGQGVKVSAIREDGSPPKMIFDPEHPDANDEGYVAMPNINVVKEMVDLVTATRTYEANVTVLNAAKTIATKALTIGR